MPLFHYYDNPVEAQNTIFSARRDYYSHKGHEFGLCWSKPGSDLMYVNIPKNASSWTKPNLIDLGWEVFNYYRDFDAITLHNRRLIVKHALVVLRDPVDRWISGIAEYFTRYHNDLYDELSTAPHSNAMFKLVFDRIAFDDHTESQVYFIEDLDIKNITFFNCDETYRDNFSKYLTDELGVPNKYNRYEYQHVSAKEPNRTNWKQLFKTVIDANPQYLDAVKDYNKKDYKLINLVKFYGSR
jgi:hypothetical protein